MSWIPEERIHYSWLDSLFLRILKCGEIPRHVAFIMDGNRRFARQRKIDKIQGHTMGFDKLAETLQWCHDMEIKEVTVYAFSIENFNRPENEVSALFNLAREKFERLVNEKEKLSQHGVRVNVLGKLDLLPEDLRKTIAEATSSTCNNTKCVLNVAFAYTSREEMTQAVKKVCLGVKNQSLQPEEISEELIEQSLYTHLSGLGLRPDLLIRTSGENRLSDFLLWQTSYSVTYFTQVLWPDFSLRNFMYSIFYYQRRAQYRQSLLPIAPLALSEEVECKKSSFAVSEDSRKVSSKLDVFLNDDLKES